MGVYFSFLIVIAREAKQFGTIFWQKQKVVALWQDAEQVHAGQGRHVWAYFENSKEIRKFGSGKREAGGRASAGRMPSSQEHKTISNKRGG